MMLMGEVMALKKVMNSHSGSHPAARPQGETNSVTLIIETALPHQDRAVMMVKMRGFALGSCHLLHSGFLIVL